MTDSSKLPPKPDVALALLQSTTSVYVHLDPRHPGVMVPSWFKKQPQLVLQIGMNMAVPIPDLDVGQEALSCTLSFNRRPEFCRMPWDAIYGLVGEDGRGMIWPESIPPEVAAASEGSKPGAPGAARDSKRPPLRLAHSQPPEGRSKLPAGSANSVRPRDSLPPDSDDGIVDDEVAAQVAERLRSGLPPTESKQASSAQESHSLGSPKTASRSGAEQAGTEKPAAPSPETSGTGRLSAVPPAAEVPPVAAAPAPARQNSSEAESPEEPEPSPASPSVAPPSRRERPSWLRVVK